MARSLYRLTADNVVENFQAAPVFHEGSDFYYRAFERDSSFFIEEYRTDDSGAKTHSLVRKVDYVVGSGNVARTYLSESEGRLYEMPLTWYSQKAIWDLSPGYQISNKRFDRLVPDRCMSCHNSYPTSVPDVEGKYIEMPEGIGCERCHGPGSLHLAERLVSPDPSGDVDLTIVNPAHLSEDLQMDVCQQCHLNTTVSLLREGRGPFDFRPSQRLEDHVALFSAPEDPQAGTIDVISHAQRLKMSACMVENSMTCTTCHDPHEGFRDKGPEYFDSTCIGCHEGGSVALHAEGGSCIQCHMPKVPAEGTPHSSFTDHWIRVVSKDIPSYTHSGDLDPYDLIPYYGRDSEGEEAARYKALAYLVHGTQRVDTSLLNLGIGLALPVYHQDSTGALSAVLGVSLTNLGRPDEAIPPLRHAVECRKSPDRLNALAQALERIDGDATEILALYEHALQEQPALSDIRINYGLYLLTQNRIGDAQEQFELAAKEKPWQPLAFTHMGIASLQDGAFDKAVESLQQALSLNPDEVDALRTLGVLYVTMPGRNEDGGRLFEHAARVAPQDPMAQANLGAWYLNNGRAEESIGPLEAAVALEPEYLDALINLALGYARTDNFAEARRHASKVLRIDPENRLAQQILDAL